LSVDLIVGRASGYLHRYRISTAKPFQAHFSIMVEQQPADISIVAFHRRYRLLNYAATLTLTLTLLARILKYIWARVKISIHPFLS
jgi:hypothetical protein